MAGRAGRGRQRAHPADAPASEAATAASAPASGAAP